MGREMCGHTLTWIERAWVCPVFLGLGFDKDTCVWGKAMVSWNVPQGLRANGVGFGSQG